MKISSLFAKRDLWSIQLFQLKNELDIFAMDNCPPFFSLGEMGLRTHLDYKSTMADPFLFSFSDRMYLFYEMMTDFDVGKICVYSMGANGKWEDHGMVLSEEFHLSYPMVFSVGQKIYMIPESSASGSVWLYQAQDFPYKWIKIKKLINESLVDTSIIIDDQKNTIYLLGTNSKYELKMFYTTSLEDEFKSYPHVITCDRSISRNAGRPIKIDDKIFRLSQDCSKFYGESIGLNEICSLSDTSYREKKHRDKLFSKKQPWMQNGYHHLSMTRFNNQVYVAVDGRRNDFYRNTLLLIFFKMYSWVFKGK